MKRFAIAACLLAATASTALAQGASFAVGTLRGTWMTAHEYIARAAEQVPEADYAFKPTPAVRSFGQLIGHVAGAERMFCAAVLGDKPAAEDDIEKSTTKKADLIAALKASAQYCAKAYALADAATTGQVALFGTSMTKLAVLSLNAGHDNEHYGNIVTYMRIKGMVPPSSQPAR
jgi:uncharacterized damage-inducible protein DinB